jgi:hypothetical protein
VPCYRMVGSLADAEDAGVEELTSQQILGDQEQPEDRTVPPAMPALPPWGIFRHPHPIVDAGRGYTLGWQDIRKVGPRFVVLRLGLMDSTKVLDNFPLTQEGWAAAWVTRVKLDASVATAFRKTLEQTAAKAAAEAAEPKRRAAVYQKLTDGTLTKFQAFEVQVLAGENVVYTIGSRDDVAKTDSSRLLGPLAGAEPMVTDGSQAWSRGRAMFLPIALAGLATKTMAHAALILADGTVHAHALDGNAAVRQAQLDAVRLNALISALASPAAVTEAGNDPTDRLRKLKELLEAGLISHEEHDAKRAAIIDSI